MTIPDAARPSTATSQAMGRFVWEKRLRAAKDISWSARATGLLLATYANRDGSNVRPGVPRLMKDTGLKERALRNHLAELRNAGYIVETSNWTAAEQRAQKLATVYQLAVPVAAKRGLTVAKGASGYQEGCISVPGKGASDCTPPDQVSPDHSQSTIPRDKLAGSTLRVEPEPDLDDWDYEDDLARIEQAVGGFAACDETTALGMLSNGMHPKAIINKILASGRSAA